MTPIYSWKINETPEERSRRELEELEFLYEAKQKKDKTYQRPGAGGVGGVGGGVIDGPLAGSKVLVTSTGKTVTANSLGQFRLRAVPTEKLEATGGTDSITGERYIGTLIGIPGNMIISPLSTTVAAIMDSGESEDDAKILLMESMVDSFGLQGLSEANTKDMLKIDYINESTQNDSNYALRLQAYSTSLELTVNLAASVIAGKQVDGDIEDVEYKSLYNSRKTDCWEKIANKITNAEEVMASSIIEEVAPDLVIGSMQEATDLMVSKGLKQIRTVANNSALDTRYSTVVIQAIQKSLQKRAESMSTVLSEVEDIGELELVLDYFGYNALDDNFVTDKGTINKVDPKKANLTVETYSGTKIKQASIYYLGEVVDQGEYGKILYFSDVNILYAEEFEVGQSVWTSTKVLRDGIGTVSYRYNWATEEEQEDLILSGDWVYTISSLIGEATDELNKNKQAYISKKVTLENYMINNDILHSKIPRSEKIELGDPGKYPDRLSNGIIADSVLKGVVLLKVNPAVEPVERDATIEGATRTEEDIYTEEGEEGEEGGIVIKKVLEVLPGEEEEEDEIVKEEFLLEKDGTKYFAEFDEKDSKNVEELEEGIFSKLAIVQDKEFSEVGKEESVATRSKSIVNYLEEAEDCMGVAGGIAQIDECDNCYEDGPENEKWNDCLGE